MIRKAKATDESRINELLVESYSMFAERIGPQHWNEMRGNLQRATEIARLDTFYVEENFASDTGRMRGVISYAGPGRGTTERIPADWASIRFLGVAPGNQGAGIGRALTEQCLALAREDGAQSIGLFTSEAMQAAQKIYTSLGFVRYEEIGRHYDLRYWLYRLDL